MQWWQIAILILVIAFTVRLVWFSWDAHKARRRLAYTEGAGRYVQEAAALVETLDAYWDQPRPYQQGWSFSGPHRFAPSTSLIAAAAKLAEIKAQFQPLLPPTDQDQDHAVRFVAVLDVMISQCLSPSWEGMDRMDSAWEHLHHWYQQEKRGAPHVADFRQTNLAYFFLGAPRR